MSFSINDKLIFIDSFQFLSSSLHSLVTNLSNNDSKYLSKDLRIRSIYVNRILSYYVNDFEKSKEELPNKKGSMFR